MSAYGYFENFNSGCFWGNSARMSRLGTEEEDRGDSQSKIFIDKIGRVIIETRYCQNKVRSRATHDVVQPRPRTFTSVFGTDMCPYTGMAVASRIVLQRVQQLSPSKCITHCPPIKQPQASSPQLSRQSRRSSKR